MDTSNTINVSDVCVSTYTNIDGMALKLAIAQLLPSSGNIVISFHGVEAVSSSFLNSSFGELVSEHGFDAIKERVRLVNYTGTLIAFIKKYMQSLSRELA